MQPGPFVPPTVVDKRQVRPPLWWFGIAGGLAIAGIVGAVALWVTGVMRLTDRVEDFTRIDVPGSGSVNIDDPGGYSIYHEYVGAGNGNGDNLFAPEPDVSVTDPSGNEVFLERYSTDVTYDFGGHEGEALYTFDAEQAGTYEVTTSGEPGTEIAVGEGIGRGLVSTIVGGFAVGGVGVVAGGTIAIVTGIRRSRSRRMLIAANRAAQSQGAPGWPGAPGGWGPPPGPGGGAPPGTGWGPPPGAGGAPQPGTGWGPPPSAPAPPAPPSWPGTSATPGTGPEGRSAEPQQGPSDR